MREAWEGAKLKSHQPRRFVARPLRRGVARLFALLLALAALAPSLAAPSLAQTAPRTPPRSDVVPAIVRIASEGARPPYNQLDEKGELAGFEIELGRALCLRARLNCVFVTQEWDQMIPGLKSGAYDAILSAMEPTDERRAEGVAFGKPYVRMPLVLLGEREDETPVAVTPEALAGRTVGVEADTPQAAWAADRFPAAELKPYASLEEAILDLASDRVDFVLARKDSAAAFLAARKEGRCCRLLLDAPRDADYLGEGFAMAFRPADALLRTMFDAALASLVADGGFARIAARYFSYAIL